MADDTRQRARALLAKLRDEQALNTDSALDKVYPRLIQLASLIDDLARTLSPPKT